ncbi:pleiotropic drug resistance ABC transporter [Pholiota molesta]|nr:pleiotropic drug resistance ABC transporter [Pholiota molesta]
MSDISIHPYKPGLALCGLRIEAISSLGGLVYNCQLVGSLTIMSTPSDDTATVPHGDDHRPPSPLDGSEVDATSPLSSPVTNAQGEHDIRSQAPPIDTSTPQQPGASLYRPPSRVSIDFFDPKGVHSLSKTLNGTHPSPVASSSSEPQSESDTTTLAQVMEEPLDYEKIMRYYLKGVEESEIKTRTLGVVFQNLCVVGLGASATYKSTLGSALDFTKIFKLIRQLRQPPTREIITRFEGVVSPGEMLLVLGRPGSGCSTFLKVLANQREEFHAVNGEVHYDSLTPEQVHKHYRGDVQYCPEDDILFPTLTTRAPHSRIHGMSKDEYTRRVTDIYLTIFGLNHVRNTPVGDASIRGVSGGEKKRVSIAETLATRSLITSWDNSTRGLDSSTALEFVRALRIATDFKQNSTIVSIYQAGESVFELFDKVCLIHEGRMAYFGPANRARQYFIDMGYVPKPRQTTPDFLVSVTDPLGRTTIAEKDDMRGPENNTRPIPQTAIEFEEYYRNSDIREMNLANIEAYKQENVDKRDKAKAYKESAAEEHSRHTRNKSPYIISIPMQVRIVMLRRAQIMKGNYTAQALSTTTFVLQAIILGTTFIKISDTTAAYFSRGGVIFFIRPALFSMSEIPSLFAQRPIILRQQKAAMYHPMVEAVAMTLVDMPFTLGTMILFSIIIYFIVRLQQTAHNICITFLVFILVVALAMKAFFRALASAFPSEAPAQALAGVLLLALSLYTGYQIPRPSMIGALRWISYINPIYYAFSALMTNEFHTLDGFNFGILCAFGIFFLLCLLIFTEFNTGSTRKGSVLLRRIKQAKAAVADDEEKSQATAATAESAESQQQTIVQEKEAEQAIKEQPKMVDTFSWQNISYIVPVSGERRLLLDNVSGFVVPGKLTALMGESGAGKTTLLNVLAERVTTGIVTGDRFLNGQPLPIDFQAQTGYSLVFSARLRQPAAVPTSEKDAYAEKCLKMCGLEQFADAIVGSLGVEQKKRTTIGVELAAKPQLLLFLDEPTSGLDSQPSAEFLLLLLLRKGGQTVYFGDLGENAQTLIDYFEANGARKCNSGENPAEYMLDVIGAGATAISDRDWHEVWINSKESKAVEIALEEIHTEGRKRPPVHATIQSAFATPWPYQLQVLLKRQHLTYWRNPTYLFSKLTLNIIGGLFIGFTFFKAKDTIQGTQNKLFSAPLGQQLHVQYISMRNIYEIRERSSRMYHWSALTTAQVAMELPWNILGSTLFFLCWYWTVGFESSRGGFTYLMFGVCFPIYYTTIALAVASMSPTAEIAGLMFSFLFSFVLTFDGVLQPYRELGWWQWMYHLSPYTYLIQALLGQVIGRQPINCADKELVTLEPPSGQTCGGYMAQYITNRGGYLTNSDATSHCRFCSSRTTDQWMGPSFNIFYDHHWRDFGFFCAYIIFNICAVYLFTYLVRVRSHKHIAMVSKKLTAVVGKLKHSK